MKIKRLFIINLILLCCLIFAGCKGDNLEEVINYDDKTQFNHVVASKIADNDIVDYNNLIYYSAGYCKYGKIIGVEEHPSAKKLGGIDGLFSALSTFLKDPLGTIEGFEDILQCLNGDYPILYTSVQNAEMNNVIVWNSMWTDKSFKISKTDFTYDSIQKTITNSFSYGLTVGEKDYFSANIGWTYSDAQSEIQEYGQNITYELSFNSEEYNTKDYEYCYAIIANIKRVDVFELYWDLDFNIFEGVKQKVRTNKCRTELRIADDPNYQIKLLYRKK